MSTWAEKLKKRRREEQEIRGYANSSRWYTGLSNAISFLERAETGTDPLNRFSDAWSVAYNLFMMHGEPGDEEYRRFNSWVSTLKDDAGVRHYFVNAGDPLIASFRQAAERVKKILLKPDGLQSLESWTFKGVSTEKASRYFFLMIRDMRNTAFHPKFNPNTAPIKKALAAAADCLIPIAAAAVEATIEHPVPHTTGKATAYRFFLYPFLKNSDGFFSDYYLERLFPDEELGSFPEDQAKELLKQIAKSLDPRESGLRTADAEATVANWIEPVLFEALGTKATSGVRIIAEEAVFQPTFVLPKAGSSSKDEYGDLRGRAAGKALSCLIWTLPWRASLDSVATEPPFTALPVTEVVHRALAASDVPWAIITNGRQLRLLSRASSHKPRCFLEADLVALLDRKADQQALRAFRFVLGLFSGRCFTEVDQAGHSLLDRVAKGSDRHGKEIGDELKGNVFSALEELGEGFLAYLRANPKSTDEWRDRKAPKLSREKFLASDILLEDIYHESLSLMYRLLFLFYAESRELLPLDNELYQTYSLESIRDDVHSVQDDPDPRRFFSKGSTDLWARLSELFGFLDRGWAKVIPPYNGGLFDPERHRFLKDFAVGDYFLARAIDLLSRTKPRIGQSRGEGRKKVTYRDLDVRHLGSIYEGILEYKAHIADQEYVIIRQGAAANETEEYKAVADLDRTERAQMVAWRAAVGENPVNPSLPRGCRISGGVDKGQYYLVFGGRESKRKSSGSYYTPDYIVQYIVEKALGPLVRGECRLKPLPISTELKAIGWKDDPKKAGPLSSEDILGLKVLDPAMGSGHFLVAATEYLARAYRDARIAEGTIPDEAQADQEFIRYKRVIAERCIYGVDVNEMAVELAKLSMWLFTMDPGRPLSFLDHHLKHGNSLVGAWLDDLGNLPSFDRFGRPRIVSSHGQGNLYVEQFRTALPVILSDLFGILTKETVTTSDILDKKTHEANIHFTKAPFKNVADLWTGAFYGESAKEYFALLANVETARSRISSARTHQYFHWELEFPEVFFSRLGYSLDDPGFSALIGNPPYVRVELLDNQDKDFLKCRYSTLVDRCDIYSGFIEQGLRLLASVGRLSIIVSGQFMTADYGIPLKELLWSGGFLQSIIDLEPLQVFEGSTTYPIILTCSKEANTTLSASSALAFCSVTPDPEQNEQLFEKVAHGVRSIESAKLAASPWLWVKSLDANLHPGMREDAPVRVGQICSVSSSLTTGKDSVLTALIQESRRQTWSVELDGEICEVAKDLWRPILRAPQVRWWTVTTPEEVVFFPYTVKDDQFELISESAIRSRCRTTYEFLLKHKSVLKERRDSRKTWEELGRAWYSLHRVGKPSDFAAPCLVSTGEFDTNRFASCKEAYVWPHARIIGVSEPKVDVDALQLFLNSPEVWSWMRAKFPPKRGGYRGMAVGDLSEVPCPSVRSHVWRELARLIGRCGVPKTADDEKVLLDDVSRVLTSVEW